MPRLLITTQVYPPEVHPTAVMVRQLATHLAGRGWEVTVAAGLPHHPYGRVYPGHEVRWLAREVEQGVEVVRLWHATHPSRAIPLRAGLFVAQALSTSLGGAIAARPDVVLTVGPPLVGPLLSALVARWKGARFVNVIYDVYPDVAIDGGHVRNLAVISAARVAEQVQYRAADLTVVLSEGFKRTLGEKGVPAERLAVIPVWLDPAEIRPMDRDNSWRREQGIALDKLVVLYAGTIGVVSGAAMVADAAALLRDRPEVLFLFVGEGEEKRRVEARARELGLENVALLPFQPRERLAEVQATADVGLVTLAAGRGRTSVPSKVLGYLAAGRPVVASVDEGSDTAELVESVPCGVVTRAGSAEDLARELEALLDAPEARARLGEAARRAFETRFSQERVLASFERALLDVCEGRVRRGSPPACGVVPMTKADCGQVADLHLASFEGFFLSKLGRSVLKLYYETIVDFGQIGLVAFEEGELTGLVTGIDRDLGFYRKLVEQRGPRFVYALAEAVLREPGVAVSILKRLRDRESEDVPRPRRTVTLTSIAVSPAARRGGTGGALLAAFREEARRRGFARIELETDAEGNDGVLAFYERQGFVAARRYRTGEGRPMVEYSYDFTSD